MRNRFVLPFACLGAAAVTFLGTSTSQAATDPGGDPVVWAVGDLCDAGAGCSEVADLVRADAETDGVLLAGDMAYDNGSKADFARFDSLFGSKTFASGATIKSRSLFVPGNHEYRDGAVTGPCPYYFVYVGAARAGSCTGSGADAPWKVKLFPTGSTMTTPGAWRVLTLNTNYAAEPTLSCNTWCKAAGASTRYGWGLTSTQAATQRSWLAAQCRAADANNQGAIVMAHHPAFTDGNYRPGTRLGRDLFSVAAANGCEIMLVGHDHLYERFTPRSATGTASATGLTQFLVGTGSHSPNTAATNTAARQWLGSGALRLTLGTTGATFEMRSVTGAVVDRGTVPLN